MGCVDPGVEHHFAPARIQLREDSRGPQPPSPMGSQAPGRSRLEIRIEGILMSAPPATISDANITLELPSRGRVGMFSLISAESAIFTIFVVAYLFYIGKSVSGPVPKDVLELPIVN